MNLQRILQEFNPSKFIVYNCLLVFTILFALRLDETIKINYWLIFFPLWVWKFLVLLGASIGTVIWLKNPLYRSNDTSYVNFKSMLMSLSLQLLLLMFELLACDKLQSGRHLWVLAFIPLIFISLLSIIICFWAMKYGQSFEMELFFSVNIIQFVFIAMKLDHFIRWPWIIVFFPLWIIVCLSIIGILYAFIFAAILMRTPDIAVEQRKASLNTAIWYSIIIIPFLVFLVLLSVKLDSNSSIHLVYDFSFVSSWFSKSSYKMSYFTVCIPLYFIFIVLIFLSFLKKGGNSWWFGIRKDFCSFLLTVFPCLREYANISYSKNQINEPNTNNVFKFNLNSNQNQPKNPVVPQLTLKSPD